jgi:hypothetical protein
LPGAEPRPVRARPSGAGRQQPALELTGTFVSQLLALAGLHWNARGPALEADAAPNVGAA